MIGNFINQCLIYNDSTTTDSPNLRTVDWARKIYSINLNKASSESNIIPPMGSLTIFDGSRTTPLDITSIMSLSLLSATTSFYRLAITAGTAGFRTDRAPTSIVGCTVTINNNAVAQFAFSGATLNAQVGDVLRIAGTILRDTGTFKFNSMNSGIWQIIGISGTTLSCVRPPNTAFSAVAEVIATGAATDVKIYSSSGIQIGDKMSINAVFSPVSQRVYEVADVTPTFIDFISTMQLPNESSLTYVADSIVFFSSYKKFLFLESDRECSVRLNADTTDNNKVTPIISGDQNMIGFFNKMGDTYKAVVVNKTINPLNLKYIIGE